MKGDTPARGGVEDVEVSLMFLSQAIYAIGQADGLTFDQSLGLGNLLKSLSTDLYEARVREEENDQKPRPRPKPAA